KIIEGTITAGTLNVQNIFGDNATIRSLIAANLDVDTLFAREATLNAINAMDITSNTYLKLMVAEKADQSDVDALGERMDAAELKITPDAIVSTVTGSQQYQDDLASVSVSGSGVEMVVGTQTATTASWAGVSSMTELKDGAQIAYWLPQTSGSNVTLNLTLADGSTTGAIPVYYSGGTRLSTQYSAGNIVRLTYRENAKYYTSTIVQGWWADANYNTDTYDRIRHGSIKAKENCTYFKFIVSDSEGCYQLAAAKAFDISKPILWLTSSLTTGYYTTNAYLAYSGVYVPNHLSGFTGTSGASLYVAGTLVGSTFLPAETYLTCTTPTEEDGLTYMLLGIMTSAYAMNLFPEHPLYRFVDGAFQPLSQVAYEAYAEVGEVRTEMRTAIEQTNAAIALKADQTTVTALSSRVDSAEQQITPEAITSKVLQSAQYAFEKTDGRNYCLNSAVEHRFVDGYYQPASGGTSTATGQRLDLSGDFFSHSNGLSRMLFSFDIKRTNIDASAAATAGVYSGFWVYYYYYGDDGTTVYSAGRGFYMRTTDANFAATDSDWVRVTYGVYNFSSYNPINVAYAYIGTSSQAGCTGTVEFRNFKVEVSNTWTDWSAAPEDIYGLASRMSTAESRITQNANNISLKVSTTTFNAGNIYRGTSAPTTIYANMLWLDLSLSPPILKRWNGSAWISVGAQEVKTSGIAIGPNQVSITTENFLLQLLDPSDNENVLMEMSANGNVGFKELYADEVISDSVASAYAGSQWLWVEPSIETPTTTDFRSLGEAVQTLNNRFLPNDVTIYLPWGWETYEPSGVVIRGISGPGKLTIYGYGENSILNSYIKVHGCFAHICFQNLYLRESRTLNGSNRQPYLCEVTKCHFVEFTG
ncbi:MAG: hypothetical protein J6K55_13640, partial [Clostridia bacterium]|nr:hypothetical protein [Clostridia bacterium]